MKGEKIMARVPMVTRTITTTKVTALCLNVETAEPFNKTVTLYGAFKDGRVVMREVKKLIDSGTEKAVYIADSEEIETLYGMTEQEFIENAKVLPPRVKKEQEQQ